MADLMHTVRSFGLTEFYLSLSPEDKRDFARYSRYLSCVPERILSCSPGCEGCFMVTNAARLLWATAANAIPDRKHSFAERLLTHALALSREAEDTAWIHANLAQLYYDRHKNDPEATRKSIFHCRELIKLGYMRSWATNLMEEMAVFHV